MSLPILRLDPTTATDTDLRPLYEYQLIMEKERSPDDPPSKFEQLLAGLRNIPPFVDVAIFYVPLADGSIGATADVAFLKTEENQHLAQFRIGVLPTLRKQGIGRRLLAEIVTLSEQNGRTSMITEATDRVPDGEHFLRRIGARVGLESHTNQLLLSELNRDLLREWQENHLPPGFTLGFWEGPYPETNIQEIVDLNELMNQVPRGDLNMDDFHFTADHLRQQEASMQAQGTQRWSCFVREEVTGRIAGFTELFWNPHRPTHARQGITAVWPDYRGKGLGRLLKASMLEKLLRERPEVVLVRTENADINAPMLKINTELGFHPYRADCVWQIETAQTRAYLDGKS